MTVRAVAAVRNPELAVRRMLVQHTVWERTAQEVVVPIVVVRTAVAAVHKVAVGAGLVDHMAVEAAVPIVVVHKVVEVARMAAVVVDSDLAAAVGSDHKT